MSAVEQQTQEEGLFNGEEYTVPYPERDGVQVAKLTERYAGSFELNRNDPADTEHAASARYGQMRRFTVMCSLSGRLTTGDEESASETLVWKIHSVDRG